MHVFLVSCGKIKLLVFKLVKPGIEFKSYLSQVKIVKHRTAVTRFRISPYKLPIETGRYANIDHDLRLCSICNSNEIGDGYFYFTHCDNAWLEKLQKMF